MWVTLPCLGGRGCSRWETDRYTMWREFVYKVCLVGIARVLEYKGKGLWRGERMRERERQGKRRKSKGVRK